MSTELTRRAVLVTGVVVATSVLPAIAASVITADAPAWEVDLAPRLLEAAQRRRTAINRVNASRDVLGRWERRNPFPHGARRGATRGMGGGLL